MEEVKRGRTDQIEGSSIRAVELSGLDQKILDLLDSDLLSIGDVARKTNSDRQFIKGVLESLRARGYVKRSKVGRAIIYQPDNIKKVFV